ncbi:MAG: AI-2E family transporter [Synechococcales bacterium]|nr:AI-2E family transporter [Synechococcales bacterium]
MNLDHWISLIALLIALYFLWQVRLILLLLLTAVVLATVLDHVVRRLQKVVRRRGVAIVLVLLSLFLLMALAGWLVVPSLIQQVQDLEELVPIGIQRISDWIARMQEVLPVAVVDGVRNFLNRLVDSPRSLVGNIFDNFFSFFSNTLTVLLHVLLITVLTIMLLASPMPYRHVFIKLFPASYRGRISDVLDDCYVSLGGWALGILFNMTVISVMSGLGLWLLGVPLALTNAVIAGVLTFIPNFGPTLSVIPPMILALIEAPWKALAVLILYIAIQQLESNLLTPLVMKRQVDLLPALTLVAQVVFAAFFGFLGLFLALPLAIIGQVILREVVVKDTLDHR